MYARGEGFDLAIRGQLPVPYLAPKLLQLREVVGVLMGDPARKVFQALEACFRRHLAGSFRFSGGIRSIKARMAEGRFVLHHS
jgi:hypothetical protein